MALPTSAPTVQVCTPVDSSHFSLNFWLRPNALGTGGLWLLSLKETEVSRVELRQGDEESQMRPSLSGLRACSLTFRTSVLEILCESRGCEKVWKNTQDFIIHKRQNLLLTELEGGSP